MNCILESAFFSVEIIKTKKEFILQFSGKLMASKINGIKIEFSEYNRASSLMQHD